MTEAVSTRDILLLWRERHTWGFEGAVAEHDGIGRRGDRQHEGVAAADGGGHHQVDRVDAQVARHLAEKAELKNVKEEYA